MRDKRGSEEESAIEQKGQEKNKGCKDKSWISDTSLISLQVMSTFTDKHALAFQKMHI